MINFVRTAVILSLTYALPYQLIATDHQPESFPGTFSGSISFTTDYRFRGVTQTDKDPAVQGSLAYSHDSGFYAGLWGSNVDFNDGDQAHLELDLYGGWTYEENDWSIGFGAIYYAYPGARSALDYDYVELLGEGSFTLSHDIVISGGVYYSPDFFGSNGEAWYFTAGASTDFWMFSGGANIGYQTIHDNANFGLPDYITWNAFLTTSWQDFEFKLEYVDTDLSRGDLPKGAGPTAIFSISRAL